MADPQRMQQRERERRAFNKQKFQRIDWAPAFLQPIAACHLRTLRRALLSHLHLADFGQCGEPFTFRMLCGGNRRIRIDGLLDRWC